MSVRAWLAVIGTFALAFALGLSALPAAAASSSAQSVRPQAVWRLQEAMPPFVKTLNGVSCPTSTDCFAVGQDALGDYTVVASTNGGRSWKSQGLPVRAAGTLYGVSCPTSSDCIAVGHPPPGPGSVVVTTTDGGRIWTSQTASGMPDLTAVSCATALDCWAVGQNAGDTSAGAIAATTDGGKTWTPQSVGTYPNTTVSLQSVSCPTSSHCVAVGFFVEDSLSGVIAVTTNGGQTWTEAILPAHIAQMWSVSCPTSQNCVAVSDEAQSAIVTSDGGATWSQSSMVPDLYSGAFTGVSCSSASECWAIGSTAAEATSGHPAIVATTDGGSTWQQQATLANSDQLASVSCATSTNCVVAATELEATAPSSTGETISTADGGTTWTNRQLASPALLGVSGISCPAVGTCWAVGQTPTGSGAVLATSNGGATWAAQEVPTGTGVLTGVSCPTSSDCWIVGATVPQGFGLTRPLILATTDGGADWVAQPPPLGLYNLAKISCPTTSDCLAVSGGQVIIGTTNGGATWTVGAPPPFPAQVLSDVSCPTSLNCWVTSADVLGSTIGGTTDGGDHWEAEALPAEFAIGINSWEFTGVSCSTASNCWVTGILNTMTGPQAVVLATTNGGGTWSSQPVPADVPSLIAISCPTSSYCQAVGSDLVGAGKAVVTTDGGLTWNEQILPRRLGPLDGVSCPGSSLCWATGETTAGGIAIAATRG